MIKKCLRLALLIIGLLFVLPTYGYANELVTDQANLFSEEEKLAIESSLTAFKNDTNMDATVLTVTNAEGKSPMEVADDFYDQYHYGTGPDQSGFLFLIDMDNRSYYISTAGKMITLIDGNRRERMLNHAENAMRSQRYADAALSMIDDAASYASKYNYNDETGQLERIRSLSPFKILLGIGAGLIAMIACYSSIFSNYSLKRSTYQYDYRQNGQLELLDKQDQLIDTFTTSRYVPRANYGNGNHTSGGGNSHGGGGRSF